MEFGLGAFLRADSVSAPELGRMAEDHGFESLLLPDHTHIPAGRETPYPQGRPLPPEYAEMLDPFVACAAIAAVTERLKLGIGVCVVTERCPIVTAKQVASIDQLSGGRFIFGVGAGWNREELRNHGVQPRTRWRLMRERVESMKEIWTQEEASYHGEFVNFDRVWSWPKPAQEPHPPILVAGNVEAAQERTLEYGDGWYPSMGPDHDDDTLIAQVSELRERAGRYIPVTLSDVSADLDRLARYEEAGIDRVTFVLPRETPDGTRATVERLAGIVAQLRGVAT
jgi:probable F420-dependent oxidoreductase